MATKFRFAGATNGNAPKSSTPWSSSPELNPSARRRGPQNCTLHKAKLSDGNIRGEIDVLNDVQQFHALLHRPLECFAAGDQTCPPRSLVDHRGLHGFGEVVGAGCAAGINQAGAPHVTIDQLVAG